MSNNILTTYAPKNSNFIFNTNTKNFFENYNEEIQKEMARAKAEEAGRQKKQQFDRRTASIASIIKEDVATPKDVNPKELALAIMETAQTAGVDPLLLACICKQESNFDQHKLGESGKGIAQITSIVPKDMYARAEKYDAQLQKLIDEYKSLDKVFAAKNANPKLNLGDFGEMLYKYKTPDALFANLQKDRNLNLKCAAYSIKFHLNNSDGDVRTALENYNATSLKKSYATQIINYMNEAKSFVKLDVYY